MTAARPAAVSAARPAAVSAAAGTGSVAGGTGSADGTVGTDGALVIKVVRGAASPAELAALTTVLLARAAALAAADPCPLESRPVAGWRRPERLAAHRDPRGWRLAGSPAA
ncbi:acyl-CoA carboxylase subunit epsilon [Streptomyces sp. NPDC048254]|uniref:acyl-CoA carboxylase subunit epsilon n=1 Tax=Streptomyces sp. NPDC048254 TaxID=3365525 RepID=UPI003712E07C